MAKITKLVSMDSEIMSDETFETMLEALQNTGNSTDVNELLKVMNENRIISVEEAEKIMEVEGVGGVVKCGLPQSVRPSDPENKTDVENCISLLLNDEPTLTEINLNNMKRTPIPMIQRLITALHKNTKLKKLSLANTGLTDAAAEPLLEMLEANTALESLNIETNFLSGEFLAKLFKAAMKNQTLHEVKCVNQSTTFSTEAEMEIMDYIYKNEGLTKVSANMRHPEARNKIEKATMRNGEIRRQKRRQEAVEKAASEDVAKKAAEEKAAKDAEEKVKKAAEEKKKAEAKSKPVETKQPTPAVEPKKPTAAAAEPKKATKVSEEKKQPIIPKAEEKPKMKEPSKETMKVYTPAPASVRPKTLFGYGSSETKK